MMLLKKKLNLSDCENVSEFKENENEEEAEIETSEAADDNLE